ncbi:MAG: hypothetical protein ACOC0U_03805 [Desulfovibrionales bacterium]
MFGPDSLQQEFATWTDESESQDFWRLPLLLGLGTFFSASAEDSAPNRRPENISARNVFEATLNDYYQEGSIYHLFFQKGQLTIPAVVTTSTFQEFETQTGTNSFLAIKSANIKII